MAKRRKIKRPRWKMKPVFDRKGKPSSEKPLNRGQLAHLDQNAPKGGPLDFNTTQTNVRQSRIIHPEHPGVWPEGLRPQRPNPDINHVPTRFPGVTPGRHETENYSKKLKNRVDPLCKVLFKGEHKTVRLWFTPDFRACIIVEVNTLVRSRKESMVYTSVQTAEIMYQLGKISWVEELVLPTTPVG